MARYEEREKAIALRKTGMSYSQIKRKLGVSKSTLSGWLRDMPLRESRLRELQNRSQVRIEKTRETKARKKRERREKVYKQVSNDLEKTKDKAFFAGFYLYWGEGTKTAEYTTSLTNSDPSIITCFVEWLGFLGVEKKLLKIKLHMYSDQNEKKLKRFWSEKTGIPIENFYKTYVKTTRSDRKTYKGMYSHGTCVVIYHNRDVYEYVLGGVRYLQQKYQIAGENNMR